MRRFLNWLFPDKKFIIWEHEIRNRVCDLERENQDLRDLVCHAWVHSGYQDCGYNKMDSKMRVFYKKILGEELRKNEIFDEIS